jgi:hypothetical protein
MRPCSAIALRFCSGEQSADECDECLEFVNTCDRCHVAGSNLSGGWFEGEDGETLCFACANPPPLNRPHPALFRSQLQRIRGNHRRDDDGLERKLQRSAEGRHGG